MCIRDSIYTIHYYEYRNDFHFDGERHDFWEFQCVDKGAAEVITDNGTYTLTRSQVIFHRPNEFHTLKANGRTAPNIIVISFACNSPCIDVYKRQLYYWSPLMLPPTVSADTDPDLSDSGLQSLPLVYLLCK